MGIQDKITRARAAMATGTNAVLAGGPGITMVLEFPPGAQALYALSPWEARRLLGQAEEVRLAKGAVPVELRGLGKLKGSLVVDHKVVVGPECWRVVLGTGEESGNGPSYVLIEDALLALDGGGRPPGPNSFFGMGRAQAIAALGEAALGRDAFRELVAEELRAALRREIRRANGKIIEEEE